MKLREHPGVDAWPPLWRASGRETLVGEIGILSNADTARTGKQCFISINFENSRYCGTLEFTDPIVCWSITKILKTRIGVSIKDIGELDVEYTL